jgi:hypothetical protein
MASQDIAVTESTQVAGARRAAARIAVELDFDETAQVNWRCRPVRCRPVRCRPVRICSWQVTV